MTAAKQAMRKSAKKYTGQWQWLIVLTLFFAGCASQDRAPLLSSGAAPIYPPQAQAQGVEGEVTVEYDVTEQGLVINAVVIQSEPDQVFDAAALKAVSSWRFTPARRDGAPIAQQALESKLSFQVGTRATDEPRATRR